ncbi:hypothetical protein INT45_004065, partial [Circinella minor]
MYSKQYKFTNVAEIMLSNPMGRPQHHPMFADAYTGESITLYYFRQLVHYFHAGLKRLGLKRGDTIYMAPIYLGVMSAVLNNLLYTTGMTISPANTSYVSHELQYQLQVGEAKVLIAHPSNLDKALEAAALAGIPASNVFSIVPDLQKRASLWLDDFIDFKQPPLSPVKMTHEESVNTVGYLCFSGGTIGRSKGVMTSHYNIISLIVESDSYYGTFKDPSIRKIILAALPLYHFGGIHRAFTIGIPAGATTIILEKYSVKSACEVIQRFKVTDFQTAPPIIINFLRDPQVDKYDLSSQ